MLKPLKICVASLTFVMATLSNADIVDTYNKTCGTCHDIGALNAPKKGDVATWNKLKSEKGMSALVKSTRQGMPRMPAMGLCQKCTNDDFEKLIEHMAK